MRYQVTAPAKKVNQTIAGVHFRDSVGEVDGAAAPSALAYFRRQGYAIVELPEPEADQPPAPAADPSLPEPPKRSASTEAWRAYAVDHGGLTSEEAAGMSRDQLAEHYLGRKEGEGQ